MKILSALLSSIMIFLIAGCAAVPPVTINENITSPQIFKKVWYRPTLEKPGLFVMTDTGTLTVKENAIHFVGKNENKQILFSEIKSISYKKLGSDFINNWVVVEYGQEKIPLYAVMSAGSALGWGGGSDKIFATIEYMVQKNNINTVIINK